MPLENSQLIHSDLMLHLTPMHFNARAKIYSLTKTQSDTGEETETFTTDDNVWAVYISSPPANEEIRRPNQTIVTEAFQIGFAAYVPDLKLEDKIKVGERWYTVLGVSHDGHETKTIATAEIVNPPNG
jgi:head-tail adaptor